jgi:hypothetical protein
MGGISDDGLPPLPDPDEAIYIGNPKLTFRVAPTEGYTITEASLRSTLELVGCDETTEATTASFDVGDEVDLPDEGSWCFAGLTSEARLVVSGTGPGGDFALDLAPRWIYLYPTDGSFEPEQDGAYVFELGEPGWLDRLTPFLGATRLEVDLAHPAAPDLLTDLREQSAVFADGDGDGDADERTAVLAAPELEPVPFTLALAETPYVYTSKTDGAAFDGATWILNDDGNFLYPRDVAASDEAFVVVGGEGAERTFGYSRNGIDWFGHAEDGIKLLAVTYAAGRFVAVGDVGTAAWSTDGRTWTDVDIGVDRAFYDVAYGAGTFVAVGEDGVRARSVDGSAWTLVSGAGSADTLTSVAWSQPVGIFVAAGDNGLRMQSANASGSWFSEVTDGGVNYETMVWDGIHFVAAGDGQLSISGDGSTWTSFEAPVARSVAVNAAGELLIAEEDAVHLATSDIGEGLDAWTPTLSDTVEPLLRVRSFPALAR